jgi:hypothetical protein
MARAYRGTDTEGTGAGTRSSSSGLVPGKRTLVETIQRQADESREDRAAGHAGNGGSVGAGTALPAVVQAKMGNAFNFDFSGVHVHEGGQAQAMGALAYTQGSQVHFAPGQYQPGEARGQELLGHELAHVVQQSEGRVAATTQLKGVGLNDDSALEREADDWGARAARGESVGRGGAAGAAVGGGDAPVQRFKDLTTAGEEDSKKQKHWANATALRVADDGTAAIARASIAGSQEMYVLSSRLSGINGDLKTAHAPLKLVKSSGSVSGAIPGDLEQPAATLDRVKPVDAADPTKNKTIPDDCGNAARTVTGTSADGKSLHAGYTDKAGKHAKTTYADPEMMKYEIMVNHFGHKIPKATTVLAEIEAAITKSTALGKQVEPYAADFTKLREAVEKAATAAQAIVKEFDTLKVAHDLKVKAIESSGDSDKDDQKKKAEQAFADAKKAIQARFAVAKKAYDDADKKWQTFLDQDVSGKKLRDVITQYVAADKVHTDLIAEIMGPYQAISTSDQESFDEKVGINRYANPGVGEAYTISSGGPPKSSRSTWNFHWGGVIFKSTTGSDNITMENYAGNQTDEWYFQMYGVPTKGNARTGQTFQEQHRDVHAQHGTTPTTLSTEKS